MIKRYDSVDPGQDSWRTAGQFMIGMAIIILAVFFASMFVTGLWIWSLLI